jgi:hypothetical protein
MPSLIARLLIFDFISHYLDPCTNTQTTLRDLRGSNYRAKSFLLWSVMYDESHCAIPPAYYDATAELYDNNVTLSLRYVSFTALNTHLKYTRRESTDAEAASEL